MKEQKYIIENQNSFELKDIFECGQCFRWNEQEDGSYIGVIKNGVIQVKKEKKICKEMNGEKEIITITGKCDGNFKEIVEEYFDLNRDYEKIKRQLENMDLYKQRQMIVEHVFGTIKRDLGYTYFLLRGNEKVKGESFMHFLIYNIKRVCNIKQIKDIIEEIKAQKAGNYLKSFTIISCFLFWKKTQVLKIH